jgi:hypothetical protein
MRFWCCKSCVIKTHEKDTHYSAPVEYTTCTDAGSADIAGANICHPCPLDIASLRLTVLNNEYLFHALLKFCHAGVWH